MGGLNRLALACGVATVALTGGTASAQGGAADETSVGEVIVTGSRIVRDGSQAPTPVTVLSQEQLQLAAPTTYADALNQLPVFQNSLRPSTTGSSATGQAGNGGNYLSLRSLGPNRTLVLLDGRRMPSNASGWVDVNLFPQILVERIDVVTGGASAAYGSDAISGVVNFIVDKDFKGVRLNAQYGVSAYEDADSYRLALAGGADALDGRLHLLGSIEHYHNDGVFLDYGGRKWAEAGWGLIPNAPGATPSQVFARDVATSNASPGTLITGTGALRDINFGSGGTLIPFEVGQFRSTSVMSGGSGGRARTNLETGVETTNLFGRAVFDVNDRLRLFVQGAGARVETRFKTSGGALLFGTIFNDNAFLPQQVRTLMAQQGVTSVPFGRLNNDFGGGATPYNTTDTYSVTVGFDADLSEVWNVSGYAAMGRADQIRSQDPTNVIIANYYRAIDAVRAPNGQIVCRSTLANPGDGCVPLNIFGAGSPSPEAVRWVLGAATAWQDNEQDVAALDVRGQLFQLPAGPLGFAAGVEYRRESTRQTVDPISASVIDPNIRGLPAGFRSRPGGFWVTNPQPIDGEFDVKEGYAEILAPILADAPFAQSLELNAAVRYADYSTAGGATTWKVGLAWSPLEDIRVRLTRSRDVRAPNLAELFTSAQQTIGTQVRDPFRGGQLVGVNRVTTGNRDLKPESADNFTLGVVVSPRVLPGFTASVDYYDIQIKDAIIPPTAQNIADACFRGDAAICPLLTRDAAGVLIAVTTPTLNVSQFRASGFDLEASYNRELLSGQITVRALATHVTRFEETSSGATLDRAGELGPTAGVPDWRATFQATYRQGPLTVQLQERFINGGKYNKTFTTAQLSAEDNSIEDVWYTDLAISYELPGIGARSQAFLSINNLFNRDPPIVPTGATTYPRGSNGLIYDLIGRYYTAGVKLRF